MILTKHATKRMRQRGKSEEDLSMIHRYGKHLGGGEFFLRKRDADKARRDILRKFGAENSAAKPIIQRLDHLVGEMVVTVDRETVVTCYHPTRRRRTKIKARHRRRISATRRTSAEMAAERSSRFS